MSDDQISKVDALKELIGIRFKASEDAVLAAKEAAEKAIAKAEHIQNDVCRLIVEVQKDIILLRETQSHLTGNGVGKGQLYGWIVAALMALGTLYMGFHGR